MLFTSHALHDAEHRRFERLGEMLGTTWTREQAMALIHQDEHKPGDPVPEPRERLVIPHLVGVNPKLVEFIGKAFGSPHGIDAPEWYQQNHGEVVDGYAMPKSEFIKLASMFTSLITKPS